MRIFQHLHAFSFPLTALSSSTSEQLAVQPHTILHWCLHLTQIACLEGIYKRKERSKEITVRNILEYLKNISNTVFSYFKITKITNIEMYMSSKIMKAIQRNKTKTNSSSCFPYQGHLTKWLMLPVYNLLSMFGFMVAFHTLSTLISSLTHKNKKWIILIHGDLKK